MVWLSCFSCPVLVLRGDLTVAERVARVQAKLHELAYGQSRGPS